MGHKFESATFPQHRREKKSFTTKKKKCDKKFIRLMFRRRRKFNSELDIIISNPRNHISISISMRKKKCKYDDFFIDSSGPNGCCVPKNQMKSMNGHIRTERNERMRRKKNTFIINYYVH